MQKPTNLTIVVIDRYDCTHTATIEQAKYETAEAFMVRARNLLDNLNEEAANA